MEFRPDVLEKILEQPDDRLWEMIRKLGAMNGISLPSSAPSHADMEQLRAMLRSGGGGLDYEQARTLLDAYRKREGKK